MIGFFKLGFFKYSAAVALVIASVGQASALSTITEDLTVFYTSPSSFTVSGLFFGSGSNLISPANQGPFAVAGGTHVSLFSQIVSLDTSLNYTFSFGGTYSGSADNIAISGTRQGFGAFQSPDGIANFTVQGTIAPVPLPASLPLFGLALISLVAIGYHSRRRRSQIVTLTRDGVAL